MEINFLSTRIPGLLRLLPISHRDGRGSFTKIFHRPMFQAAGLPCKFPEVYQSWSAHGVLRGLHFQVPPHHHTKLVWCAYGSVLDVVVDLRNGSPTFAQHAMLELNREQGELLYIPPGLAHGFYVLSESALMMYMVSTVHAPEADTGIRWDSCGIPWPDSSPRVSQRDEAFQTLGAFESPFQFVKP
jgi:dTDP-4-dehydrorhamnose 3,5-epimerase